MGNIKVIYVYTANIERLNRRRGAVNRFRAGDTPFIKVWFYIKANIVVTFICVRVCLSVRIITKYK